MYIHGENHVNHANNKNNNIVDTLKVVSVVIFLCCTCVIGRSTLYSSSFSRWFKWNLHGFERKLESLALLPLNLTVMVKVILYEVTEWYTFSHCLCLSLIPLSLPPLYCSPLPTILLVLTSIPSIIYFPLCKLTLSLLAPFCSSHPMKKYNRFKH